jgi:hypothetical protein
MKLKKLIDVKNKIKKYQCQFVLTFHSGDLGHETRIIALKKIMKSNSQPIQYWRKNWKTENQFKKK